MWFIGRVSELGRWFKSRGGFRRVALSIGLLEPVLASAAVQAKAEPAASPSGAPQASAAWHVLLAEDHALSRQVVGVLLQSMGHRVSFAVNGAEALAKVAAGGIDLVLMDIHMPVMDGLVCALHIRALPGPQARVPMVALTSDMRDDLVRRSRQVGMSMVLSKPLQKRHLQAIFHMQ
eukprot:gene37600-60933_t